MEVAEPGWVHFSNQNSQHLSLRSAGGSSSSATVFPSHIIPASAYSHQPGDSIFLSHHSSSSLPNAVFVENIIFKNKSHNPSALNRNESPINKKGIPIVSTSPILCIYAKKNEPILLNAEWID